MREQEERAQHNTQKKEAIMQLRKDLEPLIIEANETASSIGQDILFELQFASSVKDD